MRRWLAVLVVALGASGTADRAAAAEPTIVIDRAVSVASADARFPANELSTAVSLPDRWSQSRPGYEGSVWYRTAFRLSGDALPDQLLALYIERACSTLQVHLNGFLIYSGGRIAEPVTRNCSRPQLVTLPPALLRPRDNVLDLRVQGHPLSHVAARQSAAGLSRIELGLESTLRTVYAARHFWAVTWPDASSLLLIGLGCVLLAVGWLNRREEYFWYLGWLCLAWVAWMLAASARELPWRNGVIEFMLCSFWAVLLALAVQFFLTFAGLRSRVIENMVATQWVLMPLTLVLAGPEHLFDMALIWYGLLSLELAGVIGIYLIVTHRQRPRDFGPMALAAATGSLVLVAELAVQAGLLEDPPISVAQFVLPLLFIGVGTRLFLMFAHALRTTEADRNRVSGQLHQLTAELETRVTELTAQRVGQFTELERKRIASDLHDDLGAKLLTIVHTADTSRIPELAREALDEMRLSVRGLAGKAVPLDDAIADWRAEIIGRLSQASIEGQWETATPPDSPMLSARTSMQLTRVLREAVSNVIKHSGASRCEIRCTVEDNSLRIALRDNGRGIAGDLNRGHGMSTMKRRAKGVSGQCLVESRPGRGVVISLTVPL